MSNTSRIIQIPVLFDMSGSSLVFGEEATGDFVDSHLQFLLDMTTEANGISLNASDISSSILIGDQDGGDNIFFDGDSKGIGIDNLCNRMAKAITRGKLVHIPSMGNFSNSGIPIGGEGHLYSLHGDKMPAGGYSKKYTTSIAPIGDEQMLGQAMARVASVHLIGDPLGSQAFEDAASIQTSLETASAQTFNQGMTAFYNALAVQLSKVLGGSKSSAPMNPGVLVGTEKYSSDYNLTATDQDYNNDGRVDGSPLTGQVYTASSSWDTNSYHPKRAFDTHVDTRWRSTNATFDTTSGAPKGGNMVSGVNGLTTNSNSWSGFWLKVDIGQTVVLSEYKIHPRHNTVTVKNTPKEGYLLSSTDNINWVELHHLNLDDTTGRLLYYDSGYGSADTDLTALNNREGRYFAFIFQKVFTGSDQSYGGIGELELLGVTKAEFDGGNPPAAYDVASSASTLNGQSYSSSHKYDASWLAPEAFDNTHANASAWLTPSGSFTQATGELISTYQTVTFSSGIEGQWIQVDLSQNVNPGKFYLNSTSTSYPTEGWLVSSKDKTNWDVVHTLDSNNWNTHSTNRIHYEVDISGTPTGEDDTKIGSSWRLIITKMNAGNAGYLELWDVNLQGIVFPTDFGSAPSTTNQVYILDKTPYDFTSKQTNARYMVPAITEQTYTASSQWDNTSYKVEKAFLDDMQEHWRSTSLYRYHTTTGLHDFSTWTGPYRGEWIQVDLSENFVATSYVIEGYRINHADNKNSPKKGYLLGSIDNKRWNLIHTFDLSSNDANEYYNTTDGYQVIRIHTDKTSVCAGRYFRFVTEKVFPGCDGYVGMYNFRIYGVKESEAALGNGQSTTTFIDDYSLKATPYNVSVHMPTTAIEDVTISPPFTQNRYTASSTNSTSSLAWEAFTPIQNTYRWECEGGMYNSGATLDGGYYGTTLTDIYPGEWIQVDLSENVFVDSYTIQGYLHSNQTYCNSSPKKGYLLSSLDGMKWRLAHTFDVQTTGADYAYDPSGYGFLNHKITNNQNAIGKSWRFVTEKMFAGNLGYVGISQLSLYGVKSPSEIIQGDITKTTQDNSIYTLDVTPYNLTSKSFNEYSQGSSLTGQTYSASSMQNTTTYEPEHAFESHPTNNWFSYTGKYNSSAAFDGEYYGTERTGDYKGEWVQVDLSENVFADSYTIAGYFYTNQSYANSSPKKGYLLSSLDGKEWRLAHTFDVQTTNADYMWNNVNGNEYGCLNHKITNNKNAIGRYWRFVTEKMFQGNLGYLVINSFNIYGGKYPSEVTNGTGGSNTQLKLYSTPTTAIDFTLGWEVATTYSDELVPRNNINQTFTSSSYNTGKEPREAFGRYRGGWHWRSYGSTYNTTTGTYYGTARTGDYKGEWIQVDLSENYFADNYVLQGYNHTNDTYHNSSPKKGYLLSSLDGVKWRLAHTFDISTNDADYTYNTTDQHGYATHDISNNDNACGRYWRFVTEKIFAGNLGYLHISCLSINGAKETDRIEGNVVIDNSHNEVIYTLNATPYDLFNNFSELSGQVYSASSHGSTDANGYGVATTFDGFSDGYKWYSMSQYNSVSGLYYGCEFTGPYHGEWIQVNLNENVFAGSYVIQGYLDVNQSYCNSSPKKGYLLSSLDGKEWRLAHTFDITSNTATYVYNLFDKYGYITHDISNNENAIGRYWRFVTEKIFEGNLGYVRLAQFTVLGVKYPSEVTQGNGGLTTTFKNHIRTTATPYDLFNNFSELSGQVYHASSIASTTYPPSTTFDGFQDSNKWYSLLQYNTTSGLYYGSKFTGPYHGEWIQVDLSENVFAGSYVMQGYLHTNDTYHNSSPKKGYLLSSLDGKKWRLAHAFDIQTTNGDYTYNTTDQYTYITHDISNNENAIGRYWRFVTEKIFEGNLGYVRISQFTVLGVKYPSETIEGNLVTDVSRNNPGYVLNATPYDLFNNFSELSGQVYSASSHGSTDTNGYGIATTFDGFQDGYKWYSKSQYNSASGLYYGNKCTGPYHGEWIQVDLSENVFAGNYVMQGYLNTNDTYHNSSPKKGYLLSSLDGKEWRLAHTFDISTDDADYTYNTTDQYTYITHDISNNENAIGRYWRFVTEKIFEGNLSYVLISQFTVLGVKYPSEVTVSNISVDPSLNIIKNLPADMNSIYNLTTVGSTLTGQVYTASSQNTANYPPADAFDDVHSWEAAWRSVLQYNTTSGVYYGSKFTGSYGGEWIQVGLSENVCIGEYEIQAAYSSNTSYMHCSPKKSYLFSSLDGEKWNLVHTHDATSFSSSYGTYQDSVKYKLNGNNCKGRYFRLVIEKIFSSNAFGYVIIPGFIIKGVRESENTIISQSLANSYNTFTNTATPYVASSRNLRHTTQPYLMSSEKTTLISVDVSSPASTLTSQNYTASLGTANKAFDNDNATHWDISGNYKYNIFETLRTNEPNFTGWTLDPSAGLLLSFSENVQSGTTTIDKNDFSMVDNTQPNSVILSTDISNGKVLVNIAKSFIYNDSVTEYDLASTSSTLMGHVTDQNRNSIYTASSYYNTSYYPYEAFDAYATANNDNNWISVNNSYANQVNTNNVITVVDGTDVIGEWLQVELPENVLVKTFKYLPRPTTLDSIQEAVLVVSKNGTTWTQIGSISRTLENYTNTTVETYSTTAHISGKYVRLIIVKNWTAITATVGELTLLGQKQSEAVPIIITSHNNLKLTYTKNASKDKNIIGATNNVAVNHFATLGGTLLNRGLYFTDSLATNEPNFTSSQVVGGKLEYTFGENLQAGTGGLDITDFQLIDNSGTVIDISNNGTSITGGKLLIGSYVKDYTLIGNEYDLAGDNATHENISLRYYKQGGNLRGGYEAEHLYDDNEATTWLGHESYGYQSNNLTNQIYNGITAYNGWPQMDMPAVLSTDMIKTNNNSWNGDWLKVDMGETVIVSEIKIYPRPNTGRYAGFPKQGVIVSSNDGHNWDLVGSFSGMVRTDWYDDTNWLSKDITVTGSSFRTARWFALVVEKTLRGEPGLGGSSVGYANLGEFEIYGVTKTEQDGGSPPAAYNLAVLSRAGLRDRRYYASSQYGASTNWTAFQAFDGDTTGNGDRAWTSVNGTHYNETGDYIGPNSIASGPIRGNWVQVDMGINTIVTDFTLAIHSEMLSSAGRVAGSLDGETFTTIGEFKHTYDVDPSYVTININSNDYVPYRYFRLIIENLYGSQRVRIMKWMLNGYTKTHYYVGETINDIDYSLIYNKNASGTKNIIGATNSVAVNNFRIDNDYLVTRGNKSNIGLYNAATTTTLADTSTYTGEWIQLDIGENVFLDSHVITIPTGYTSLKSYLLLSCLDGSSWTKLYEVTDTNETLTFQSKKGRYVRLAINKIVTDVGFPKLTEFKINGTIIKIEGQTYSASLDNGDANTVFNNSITTSWDTSSAYNYNGMDTAAANEATYSSVALHQDASGNNRIELTFSADLSSNDLKATDFTVTETDFSTSIPLLADISGGKLLFERQANIQGSVFYENFDDQVILGEVTTADIVQKGIVNGQAYDFGNTGKTFTSTNGAGFGKWHAMGGCKTSEINGKYYISGYTMNIDEINLIDASMNRITTGGRNSSASQNANRGHAMFAYNNCLYMYGGGAAVTQLDKYDVSTDTWTFNITTNGTAPTFHDGAFTMNGVNKLIVHYQGATNQLDLTTMTWTNLSADKNGSTTQSIWCPSFVYNNRFYTYGGGQYAYGRYYDLEYLDLANTSNGWTTVTINDPNNLRAAQGSFFSGMPRNANGVAVKDGKMYYVGGYDQYFSWYDNIAHYIDLTNETVYDIRPGLSYDASVHGFRHTHFFIGDILYLFGAGTSITTSGGANGWHGAGKNELLQIDITKTQADFGYRLQGEKNIPKIWRIVDQTFLALSFWYKNGTGSTIFDSYNSTDSNATYSGGDGQKDWLYKNANKLRLRTRSPANIERWYQNGVVCSNPGASEHHGTDSHTAMTVGTWHHVYIEFKTANDRIQFFARKITTPDNGDDGSIDQVRFYDRAISEAHIKEMANGWDGMYPGASFDKTDYLIEYNKNTSSAHNIYDVNNTTVPINDFIIRNGSLISRGTNYGHYSGSTTTTLADTSTSTGEYIEVNIGQQTFITNYELHVPASNVHMDNNVYPKSWILLGSADGSAWTKIHEVTDYAGWATNSHYGSGYKVNYMNEITNMTAQYYRLIINKTYGKVGYTSVAELLINGVKHTSETTGITLTKTASLGTAANAFDSNISTDWNTSSSATYGTFASTVTNEPIFSSGTINGSSQIELTFDTNIDISGTFNKVNLAVTNSSYASQAYNASIDSGKLLLTYNPEQLPGLDTIFIETFDDQTTTDPLGAVGSIVAGGKDGLGYALQRNTSNQSHTGLCWDQTTLPENIKTICFWYIIDETDLTGTWNNLMWLYHNTSYTYVLRFAGDNHLGQGTSHQGHQVEKYYIDGVLCGGANLVTSYDTDITEGGNPVTEESFQGTWRHVVLEFQNPLNDPNVTNSAVSKIRWLTEGSNGFSLKSRIDDIRFYDQALTQSQITTLATNNLVGTFSGSLSDYNIQYTKTNNGNLVNASHTSVGVNSFAIVGGTITNRGDDGIGEYTGSTSTTLPDSSTYDGEWIQIDVGQTILMTDFSLVVPNKDAYSNPKSWKLLISQDNTNWIEALDVSGNTIWDSGFASASTDYTGFQIGSGLANNYIGRYFKVIVNSLIGPANHVKINEIVIKGVSHTLETQGVVGDQPILYTATESSNTTSQNTVVTTTTHNADDTTITTVTETIVDISANTVTKTTTKKTTTTVVAPVAEPTVSASNNTSSNTDSTVTTTTHNADDTTITTVTETTVDIATNTVTTTTTKTTVTTVTSHVSLNTATPSSTTTVHSDTTALTTTYNNNDTSVRTVVNRTIDISANTDTTTNLNAVKTITVSGFGVVNTAGSSFDPNKIYDVSGVACPALKSIYEQLMNIPGRSQIMESQDFSTSPMPSVETITGGFPFIAGDKLVMYIRPKIQFAQATFPEQFTSLISFGDKALGSPAVDIALASGSGGGVTGQTYTKSSEFSGTYAVSKLFDGNTGSIWITASDTFNATTQLADTNKVSHSIVVATGGDTSDMASQIYHEDFQDQSYDGSVTGAPVVNVTGHTGLSTYVVETKIDATERWAQTGYDTVKTFSFWHKYIAGGKTSGTYIFEKIINGGYTAIYWKESDSNFNFEGYNTANSTFYLNGVPKTSGNIPHDATQWTHYCFTFDDTNAGSINWGHPGRGYESSTQYHTNGYFDDVRFFNEKLTATQIADLAAGGNGNDGKTYETYSGHYAQIEFTESMAVEKLKLTPRSGGGGGAGEPVDFRIFVSDDESSWTDVLHVSSSQIQPNWNKNGNDWATHEWFIPLSIGQGKYWRLLINRISTGNKVQLAKMELMGGLTSELTGGGDQAAALSIPGLETNVTNQATTFPVLFPGNTTGGNEAEAEKYGWVGSANADTLALETTDETDIRTMDLHIWKITITL